MLPAMPECFLAQGVDWKRAFALGMWYAQSPTVPVSGASLITKNIVQLRDLATTKDLFSRRVWDLAFQLFKLYSRSTYPLESALVSESFSPSRTDARFPALFAWLLSGALKVRGFGDSVPASGSTSLSYDRLLASWAHPLECLGMWHWSCYLLLQLSSPDELKENAIRSLLERSLQGSAPPTSLVPLAAADLMPASSMTQANDKIDFVLNHLHLPAQWLYEAYATRSRYNCNWTLTHTVHSPADAILCQVVWIINAGQYSPAHMLVLQRIAPDAILRGEYNLLGRVLGHLDPSLTANRVPLEQWQSGGRVFLLFLSAVRDLPAILSRIANDDERDTMEDGMQQIALVYEQMQGLLLTLPSLSYKFSMPSGSTGFFNGTCAYWYTRDEASELKIKYSVTVSDMASVITGFIQEMTKQVPGLPTSFPAMSDASARAAALPLAQDMRIMRTYQMARTCFNSLIGDELSA